MIVHEVMQNSADWWDLRLGIPTASAFASVLKKSATWLVLDAEGETVSRHTGEGTAKAAVAKAQKKAAGPLSIAQVWETTEAADTYLNKLLAEYLTRAPIDDYQSAAMERGHDLEPEAWRYYEFEADTKVTRGGFCTTDDGALGASPDGRVYDGNTLVGGIELKCPHATTHVGYIRNPDSLREAYRHQVQGSIIVTGAQWWDLMSYHPLLPPVLVRVRPEDDAGYVGALRAALEDFAARVAAEKVKYQEFRRDVQ